jgi:hypothetical protein
VDVDEVQPRRRAPVAHQSRFDVCQLQRLLQKRIVIEIERLPGTPLKVGDPRNS